MIDIQLRLKNPFSNRFTLIGNWYGKTPIPHKWWECEFYRSNDILAFGLSITHRQDHAGLHFTLGLLFLNFGATIYDNRHWDYKQGEWRNHDNAS